MKQTTFAQRLVSALVALCMVLSVCAPALAADGRVIWIQKNNGLPEPLNASTIGKKLPGCSYAYDGTTVTITMAASETRVMEGVKLTGGPNTDIILVCTNNTQMDSGLGLTITGMRNVTIKTEDPSKEYTGAFYGALKVTDCHGNVTVTNPHGAAVVYSLDVDNTAGTGNVTITGSYEKGPICAVAGGFGNKVNIASNGDVKIENIVSGMFEAQLRYQAVDGKLTVTNSKSVTTTGGASEVNITSTGAVEIKSDDTKNVVGNGLSVNAGGAVTVTGGGAAQDAAAIKGDANITAGGGVKVSNLTGIAVDGNLTIDSSTGVTVVGNTSKYNTVQYAANITSSGAVNISNSSGIAVGGKLTVKNASGTGDVTVTGKGGNTVGGGAKITSKGAVNITNTGSGLAVSGDLTVHDSGSVKVSGGNASVPAVDGNITLTSTGKMELSNPKGQVTSKKLTVTSSTGDVSVTGSKSDGSALVKYGASIDTTGAVTITNSSGPAIFGGLNVEQSGSITVKGSWASAPIITGNSTIKNTDKVEIVNQNSGGQTAESITYTPPAGKGYFYQTAQNGTKLHTRKAISGTTPYLYIGTDTIYTLTLSDGVTATTGGTKDTKFYAGESVTVTAPQDTETNKFKQWNFSGTVPTVLPDGWQTSREFTFKMPAGNVNLNADYKTAYTLTVDDGRGSFTVNGEVRTQALEGETVTVKTSDAFFDAHHQFNGWSLSGDSAQLVSPSEGWETSKTFTFTMPAGNVSLKADYKQLYDLTVKGGTIDGESGDTSGIYLPGTQLTVRFTESTDIEKQFKQWTYEGTRPEAPKGTGSEGGWDSSKEKKDITFTMPTGDVTLKAEYKDVYTVSVENERGTVLVNGAARTQALEGETVTVKTSDAFFDAHHQFDGWSLTSGTKPKDLPDGWENSTQFTFTMPAGNVNLKADYKQLYDLTVEGGTIDGESGKTSGIYLPGTEVTIAFDESTDIKKQFKQWTYEGTRPEAPEGTGSEGGWDSSKEKKDITFTMPTGDVTLKAEYKDVYTVSVENERGTVLVNGEERTQALAGETVKVKTSDTFFDAYHQFNGWSLTSGTEPTDLPDGWQTSREFTFTMPADNVSLTAGYKQLYDVTVTGGTIEGGTDDNGIYKKIVKPGELVTVRAESTEENPFQQWTCTGTAPAAPDDGWTVENWETSREFTFKMPSGNVTLEAQHDQLYKVSIHDNLGNVTINGEPRESLWVKEGETVTVATTLKDGYWMEFEEWNSTGTAPEEPVGGWTETNKSTSTTFTFKMPKGTVELTAGWQGGAIEKPDPEDPNTEPLDPGFTVDPEPAAKTDTAGAALVAAAVGGAAVWGGYEVATRVLLHKLLPEGAAIPKTRAELALLLWNAAGQPEPAAVPAFADVADPETAKAAQWCTEQGCLTVKEPDRFQPDKHVTKYRVIDCWNKAFPAA